MINSSSRTIKAGQVPSETLTLLLTKSQTDYLIFSADDLINILLYVRSSRQLPQNFDEFVKELGVENLVKEQASDLTIVSKNIVNIGSTIIEVINRMDIRAQIDATSKDTTVKIPITSDKDKKIQTALPEVINKLKQTCVKQKEKSHKLLTAVRDYKTCVQQQEKWHNVLRDYIDKTKFLTQFKNLEICLVDAEQALAHLEFLWIDIVQRIDQSVDKWKEVEDSQMLLVFIVDLKLIVDPWKEVGNMSTKLLDVFDQAYEEFRKTL